MPCSAFIAASGNDLASYTVTIFNHKIRIGKNFYRLIPLLRPTTDKTGSLKGSLKTFLLNNCM